MRLSVIINSGIHTLWYKYPARSTVAQKLQANFLSMSFLGTPVNWSKLETASGLSLAQPRKVNTANKHLKGSETSTKNMDQEPCMDSLNDGEITPIKKVEKLARIAGSALNDGVKKHVKKNHMLPAKMGKSYFLSSEEAFVWSLVQQACNCPDTVVLHRSRANRFVLKKNFNAPVGIHGKTGSPCVCVTVIYDIREQRVVTAFPSL